MKCAVSWFWFIVISFLPSSVYVFWYMDIPKHFSYVFFSDNIIFPLCLSHQLQRYTKTYSYFQCLITHLGCLPFIWLEENMNMWWYVRIYALTSHLSLYLDQHFGKCRGIEIIVRRRENLYFLFKSMWVAVFLLHFFSLWQRRWMLMKEIYIINSYVLWKLKMEDSFCKIRIWILMTWTLESVQELLFTV